MRKIVYFAVIILIASSVRACAEGLDTLVDMGKSMADIGAAMDEETDTFNRVKSAVDSGKITRGSSGANIRARYGEPVIISCDSAAKKEKWAYKPASSSFFKGVRIYLLFDDKGALDEIRILS